DLIQGKCLGLYMDFIQEKWLGLFIGKCPDLVLVKEELETYKRPSTCPLKIALKYSVPWSQLQTTESNSNGDTKSYSRPIKRRKTLLFTHLLTNNKSLQELEGVEELAKSKAKNVKKKEAAAEKQAKYKLESAQRKQLPQRSRQT
ncbi:5229_t:CDS:2, partial [Gigaspora margarita]